MNRGKFEDGTADEKHKMIENKDLTRIMSAVLDKMGRFQVLLFFALVANALIYGMNHTLTAFHIYTPSFTCQESGNVPNSCQNITDHCPSGYNFANDDYTIVVEWELVCGRRFLAPLINTLYFVGVTLGALICGIWTDRYGRKLIMLICLFTQGVIGLLLQLSPNLFVFIPLRVVQGFFVQGLQGACIALLFEYTAPRMRKTAIVAWHIFFALGALILAGMSFSVHNWKMLQNVITIPTLIIICYEWAIPESVYWLYTKNRKRHALQNCLTTAKYNKDKEMVEEITTKFGNDLSDKEEKTEEIIVTQKAKVIDIWHSNCLRLHLIVLVMVNFSITISYYGSVFFLNKLGGNRHVNFAVGSMAEIVGFALVMLLLWKIGTRITIITYQFTTGFLLVIIGLIINFLPEDTNLEAKVMTIRVMCLIAKAIAMSSFATMILFNTELFPTICRASAFGICGFAARAGSILAPFLMLLADYAPIIPMLILGILLVISGSLSTFMPDTRNVDLPHTIEEAETLWQKSK